MAADAGRLQDGTSGDVQQAVNAIAVAAAPHQFLGAGDDGVLGVIDAPGNPDAHLVSAGRQPRAELRRAPRGGGPRPARGRRACRPVS